MTLHLISAAKTCGLKRRILSKNPTMSLRQSNLRLRLFSAASTVSVGSSTLTQRLYSRPSVRFQSTIIPSSSQLLQLHEPVQQALREQRPVVALESTIVAHGMPYPQNWELSQELAALLRERGVEPATIALCNGTCRIGLTLDELHDLAQQDPSHVTKCSTRELSLQLAWQQSQLQQPQPQPQQPRHNLWGATTVASTMVLAHQAGIQTFVTGGIGGVHRGAETSMDVSTDLVELSRTPVVVVSAGIKSILDISKTLEVLETYAVPTVAFRTNDFPAFFSPSSGGIQAPARVDDASEVASAYWAARGLQLSHGMLVAVPNQDPAGAAVEEAIQAALVEADDLGIRGRDVTPYILKRVAETTHGESLRSNMSLVKQNTIVGAEIAIEIAKQQSHNASSPTTSKPFVSTTTGTETDRGTTASSPASKIVVMGGIVVDTVAKPHSPLLLKTSNPATCHESDGGVARNIAEALGQLGARPCLYSAVGDDISGRALVERLQKEGGVNVTLSSVPIISGANTASYLAVLDDTGDLHTACADMSVLQQIAVPPDDVLEQAEYLVVDANPPIQSLLVAAQRAHRLGVKVFFEPTSVPKAMDIASYPDFMKCVSYASPNVEELCAMVDWSCECHSVSLEKDLSTIQDLSRQLLNMMNPRGAHLLVTMGARGVLYASSSCSDTNNEINVTFQHHTVHEDNIVVANATGAGDTFSGAFLNALLQGKSTEQAIEIGMDAAVLSLTCANRTISPQLQTSR